MNFAYKTIDRPLCLDGKSRFLEITQIQRYKTLNKLYSDFVVYTHEFYKEKNISPVLLPITCGSISSPMGLGSDSLPVKVNLFGCDTYLADSMQFQLEYMLRFDCEGVYYIMPTFRGEDPDERHLNQFFHSEAEILGNLSDVINLIEKYFKFITEKIFITRTKELKDLMGNFVHIENILSMDTFPQISYKEATRILGENPIYYSKLPGNIVTISYKGEQKLIQEFKGVVWLTHLPSKAVPFYQAFDEDKSYARCADLLIGIGEVVGCGERHETYEQVKESLTLHHVSEEEYGWYIEMKKQYPMKTSGFGLGLERYLLWLLKHNDIRDMHIINRLKGELSIP
jgi:aspartyl/asparaginyl-tRNA synthetase